MPRSLHLAIQLRKAEFLVVAGLALKVVEDAVAALNEAEADEAVERRQHIPTARARRMLSLPWLQLNPLHGDRLLLRKTNPLLMVGALLQLKHLLRPRSHRASFQTA